MNIFVGWKFRDTGNTYYICESCNNIGIGIGTEYPDFRQNSSLKLINFLLLSVGACQSQKYSHFQHNHYIFLLDQNFRRRFKKIQVYFYETFQLPQQIRKLELGD
jgi:hypothetical protein